MTAPKRVQRMRVKGWRKPEGAVNITRPGKWGNPFVVGQVAQHRHRATTAPYDFYVDTHRVITAEQAAGLYRAIVTDPVNHQYVGHETPTLAAIRAELAGKDLMCFCAEGDPCHGDVLLSIAAGGDGTCPPPST